MGGRIYKMCDQCKKWVHRDETVLRRSLQTRIKGEDRIRDIKTRSRQTITNSHPDLFHETEHSDSLDRFVDNSLAKRDCARICLNCAFPLQGMVAKRSGARN
jgi:hypothetical protein